MEFATPKLLEPHLGFEGPDKYDEQKMHPVESSSSLAATEYDPEEDYHRPGSAPPTLNFDSSAHFYGFDSQSPLFSSIRKYEDPLGNDGFETSNQGQNRSSPISNSGLNQLSPHSSCSNNQLSHEDGPVSSSQSSGEARGTDEGENPMSTKNNQIPLNNSLEMFLSRSPSQALGEDFMKINLGENDLELSEDYFPSQFRLDHNRRNSRQGSTSYEVEDTTNPRSNVSSSRLNERRSVYPSYSSMPSNPENSVNWGTQITQRPYASGSGKFYSRSIEQPTSNDFFEPEQPRPQYESAQTYGVSRRFPQTMPYQDQHANPSVRSQWNHPSVTPPPPPASMNRIPMNGSAYGSQGSVPLSRVNYGPPLPVRPNRRGYSRMAPPLPENSPPMSPHHNNLGGNSKQCKFFLQGHCRMGNKCKFSHQVNNHMIPGGVPSTNQLYLNQQQVSPHVAIRNLPPKQERVVDAIPPQAAMHSRQGRLPSYKMNESSRNSISNMSGNLLDNLNENDQLGMSSSDSVGTSSSANPSVGLLLGSSESHTFSTSLSVDDIKGRVFAMSKDQNGCRLLQEQLDYEDRVDLCEVIYSESLDHLSEMMVDPFGNYLFQKLLERVKYDQRLVIVKKVSSNLVAAALNLHGTRSVQKVVEICASSDQSGENSEDSSNLAEIIVDALKDDAVRLCIDSNGNHVIQRALQFMPSEYNQFVFDAVCKECTTVGTHRHGCCVLQRCLDAANKEQKHEIILQVEKHAMKLMQDPYGNYVVQYVLDSCNVEEANGLITKPLGHIFELSIQKFSSNVIEKCLEKAPEFIRQKYIKEIILCPKIGKMLQDQFANYVVQRALAVSSEEQCLALVEAIRPHLASMKHTSGGRRISNRIEKRFPNLGVNVELVSMSGGNPYEERQPSHSGFC